MNDWNLLAKDYMEWSKNTFPETSYITKCCHLEQEIAEIKDSPEDRLEWADAMLLLIGGAALVGFSMDDLYYACREKLEINKTRKWSEPDENGVRKHL